ncbi:MAG: metal ABC transporter substrate-binding protein [Gammaproteobacteria bacterium]|nr:metal ABC transporter substrate-binding protein [Gammaproteobacteria bacterium]
MLKRRSGLGAVAVLSLGSAAWMAQPMQAAEPVPVVVSFTILGDFVSRIGGSRVAVRTLVGSGEDTHTYVPSPRDAKALRDARLIVINGLGFEGWMTRLVQASGTAAPLVRASDGVELLQTHGHHVERGSTGTSSRETHHLENDPHAWLSAINAVIYVRNIAQALCRIDGGHCAAYRQRADEYAIELQRLDKHIREQVARVPAARRRVVAAHAAFGYFAAEYGMTFLTVLGTSTHSEASAAQVARLIRQARRQGANAIFVENIADPRLMQQVAREMGIELGGVLYADALGAAEDGPASYVELMRRNVHTLVEGILQMDK